MAFRDNYMATNADVRNLALDVENEIAEAVASIQPLDVTEIGYIDGAVAGIAAENKAVVLTTDKVIDELDITLLKKDGTEITASGAELNILDLSDQTETIDTGAAVSVTKRITKIDNTIGGAGSITLAAPDTTMLGQVKIIEMTVDNGDVALALTNVQGGTASTTATFAAVNDALILIAGVTKWHVIGQSGVTLS